MPSRLLFRHAFTPRIEEVLRKHFGEAADDAFQASPLLGYLNFKTRSATRGSKSRGSFANHYALYVIVEDYISKGYAPGGDQAGKYSEYEGARSSDLIDRQNELPFGQKLQNHALNSRLNGEFKACFPTIDAMPIVRDIPRQRYWVHEDLLNVDIPMPSGTRASLNLAAAILEIIDIYVATKREAFESFIESCRQIAKLSENDTATAIRFIKEQVQPNVDARMFEIVSFSILKAFYGDQHVFWGWTRDVLNEEVLTLYKTGRTNANDGGIDFVMRPLGRFFQVTETINASKYLLDIDKVQRFPLTFVVKSLDRIDQIRGGIERQASSKYSIRAVVKSYMDAIEEIINIPLLMDRLRDVEKAGNIRGVMAEIIVQSRLEFNYTAQDDDDADEDAE